MRYIIGVFDDLDLHAFWRNDAALPTYPHGVAQESLFQLGIGPRISDEQFPFHFPALFSHNISFHNCGTTERRHKANIANGSERNTQRIDIGGAISPLRVPRNSGKTRHFPAISQIFYALRGEVLGLRGSFRRVSSAQITARRDRLTIEGERRFTTMWVTDHNATGHRCMLRGRQPRWRSRSNSRAASGCLDCPRCSEGREVVG